MTIDLQKQDTQSDFKVIMLYETVDGCQRYGVYDCRNRTFIAKDGSLISPLQTSLIYKCCSTSYLDAVENAEHLSQIRKNIRNKKLN